MSNAIHVVVRVLVFVLGLAIVLDALIEQPSSTASIIFGCVLMGVISFDQIRSLLEARRRNGASTQVHEEGDHTQAETAVGSRLPINEGQRGESG